MFKLMHKHWHGLCHIVFLKTLITNDKKRSFMLHKSMWFWNEKRMPKIKQPKRRSLWQLNWCVSKCCAIGKALNSGICWPMPTWQPKKPHKFTATRWQIESHFKLLKSSGHYIEDWQQKSDETFFKRLADCGAKLPECLAFYARWQSRTRDYCLFWCAYRVSLSRRQSSITVPALFLGYLKLLAAKELLDEITPDEICAAVAKFTQKIKWCR